VLCTTSKIQSEKEQCSPIIRRTHERVVAALEWMIRVYETSDAPIPFRDLATIRHDRGTDVNTIWGANGIYIRPASASWPSYIIGPICKDHPESGGMEFTYVPFSLHMLNILAWPWRLGWGRTGWSDHQGRMICPPEMYQSSPFDLSFFKTPRHVAYHHNQRPNIQS
jgi:hypothetical protein